MPAGNLQQPVWAIRKSGAFAFSIGCWVGCSVGSPHYYYWGGGNLLPTLKENSAACWRYRAHHLPEEKYTKRIVSIKNTLELRNAKMLAQCLQGVHFDPLDLGSTTRVQDPMLEASALGVPGAFRFRSRNAFRQQLPHPPGRFRASRKQLDGQPQAVWLEKQIDRNHADNNQMRT